jgi:hypothetical protein
MVPALLRPNFYSYLYESESLDSYVHDQIRVRLMRRRAGLLDERNIHSYRHGNRWTLEASANEPSTLRTMAAESTIHTIDIINHETAILEKHIETMVEQLFGDLMKHLYQTVGEAAESTGNTIRREDHRGNIPAGFLAMLEKIEFGVDRYGSAQRPSIHVAPSTGEKFISALNDQPDEYHLRVETISVEKERKAIAREAERIARFRWKRN